MGCTDRYLHVEWFAGFTLALALINGSLFDFSCHSLFPLFRYFGSGLRSQKIINHYIF